MPDAQLPAAGTSGARDRPAAASTKSRPASDYPPSPQAERRARHTGAVARAPSPAHCCARGRGPAPSLSAPRLKILFRDQCRSRGPVQRLGEQGLDPLRSFNWSERAVHHVPGDGIEA